MKVLILQPPIVQLNTAYPSGAYLQSFFNSLGCETKWYDLNIYLFDRIFSKEGLSLIFEKTSEKALKMAQEAEEKGQENVAFNLRRYISDKDLWINWIETIKAILRPGYEKNRASGFENSHRFIFGAHVPRGSRMENYLSSLEHDLTTDDSRSLASFALADIADYITAVFDENFSLVRYAERLTVSESTFEQIEKGIDSPVLKEFYEPLLHELFDKSSYDLVLVSVPFAGTFTPALFTGRYFKTRFNDKVYVSFGGGFVNTELRDTTERSLVKYCDALCYDRGYASYKSLIEEKLVENKQTGGSLTIVRKSIFKLRQFFSDGQVIDSVEKDLQSEVYEKKITSTLIPVFDDIDYSRYPRLIDDTNPMHRLWSDGAWIKAYMAHGCYWHQCAFCDVTLDYVKSYCLTDIKKLYAGLLEQCTKKGVYGIHFVDEAMPPVAMVEFARENIAHGSPLTWWGNVRFEKAFSRDVADFLSYGGLIGVSAGLESATGNGLDEIHKGTDLKSIVSACCAFKEAGILVHAYMIYGYWKERPVDLMNSMETLRQFYANGLIDSCFWHKFVLTRHSRIYKEWKEGKFPELKPVSEKNIPLFAKNGLHFEGEKQSEKFGAALDFSLNEWMHGKGLNKNVQKWFDFSVPKPEIQPDFIESLINEYEQERDKAFKEPLPENKNRIYWLGGKKFRENKNTEGWMFMGEMFSAKINMPENYYRGKGLCVLPDWPCLRKN